MPHSLPLLALSCLLTAPADQDWTRFRGPNGSGESEATGIPAQWTDRDYLWKVPLPGMGYSSPVVWGDRVFVTSAKEDDATRIVLCLSTKDGSLLWKGEFPSKPHAKHKFNCYASSTPAMDARRVYCLWATPESYTAIALDKADGREVWRRDLGPFLSENGFGASPIVFEDLLIVPNDQDGKSFVVGLDGASGQVRWQTERRTEKTSYATPVIWQPEGKRPQLILSSWAQGVSSVDPRTGKPNWELPLFRLRTVNSPTIAGGLIFAGSGVGGVGKQMIAVRPGDPEQGIEPKLAYNIDGPIPYVTMPVAKGNLLFLWHDGGVLSCLDAPTGKLHWRQRIGGNYFSSPIRVGDRLYCTSREGEMVVLAAADKYELIARFPLGERTNSTPAVAGGVMYLRTVGHLMAVGGKR